MPFVRVVHTTEYHYANPVRFTTHRMMLRPRDSHDLRLIDTRMGITPAPSATRWSHDVFGNSVCYLDWDEATEADLLRIVSVLELQHFPADPELKYEKIDPGAEIYPFGYASEEFPDLARLLERHHPDPRREVDAWARRFLNSKGPTHTMDLLVRMTQAIKQDFTYEARDAEGTNPPLVTLATGQGACRDFTLLMMEAVRSLGFAARFISGYLYDESLIDRDESSVVGGGATHAWCAVYLPGAGWVEFDPTNGLIAGRNLIRVCGARTPEQAVPIGGGYLGTADDFTRLDVNVEVTVGAEPFAEAA